MAGGYFGTLAYELRMARPARCTSRLRSSVAAREVSYGRRGPPGPPVLPRPPARAHGREPPLSANGSGHAQELPRRRAQAGLSGLRAAAHLDAMRLV